MSLRDHPDNPASDSEGLNIFDRRQFLKFLLILTTMPGEASAENERTGILSINGEKINIADVAKLNAPLKNLRRIMEYPMSDEARKLLKVMKADESFLKAEDYKSSDGNQLILRKTAVALYRLAQKYAAMEGYGMAIFSAYRSPSDQNVLYKDTDKNDKGGKVALAKDSQHVRGGAKDVLLYKKENGRIVTLTPDKAKPDRGTQEDIDRLHKYLQLAGFVNYTPEPWHNEIGSEEWVEIMIKAGIFTRQEAERRLYKPVDKPIVKIAP